LGHRFEVPCTPQRPPERPIGLATSQQPGRYARLDDTRPDDSGRTGSRQGRILAGTGIADFGYECNSLFFIFRFSFFL